MKDYSQALSEAMRVLVNNAITADEQLINSFIPELTKLLTEGDSKAIARFFSQDAAGLKLWLTKGIRPTTFSGIRFVSLLDTISQTLDVMLEAERAQVTSFVGSAGLSEQQQAELFRQSLFMSPTIKQTLLDEWVNQPYRGHKLSERVWDLSKVSEETLLKAVASGFADGQNPKQLAPMVRKLMGDNSSYNIRRLLLTENSRVQHGVQKLAVKEFKHIKYVKLLYGVRHKQDCPCTAVHNKGNIVYDDAPNLPLHPNSSSYYQPQPTPIDEWKRDMGYA